MKERNIQPQILDAIEQAMESARANVATVTVECWKENSFFDEYADSIAEAIWEQVREEECAKWHFNKDST